MTQPTLPRERLRFDEALAEVAAAKQGLTGPTPAQMAAAAGESTISVRERAAAYLKRLLLPRHRSVNPYDQAQVDAFAAAAAKAMAPAQKAVAKAAAAGVAQQFKTIGITVKPVVTVGVDVRGPAVLIANGKAELDTATSRVRYDNGDVAVVKPDEMTTEEVFKRPAAGFRWIESTDGEDPERQSGLRVEQLIDDNLMLAQRLGETQAMAAAVNLDQSKVTVLGYRRVIHPEMSRGGVCGLCIAAADRIYRVGELKPIHSHCKCTIAPVTEDHDPGDEVNSADLKKLYDDAGGTSAADLKRTRYKIDQHGELSAVLVPDKRNSPKTAAGGDDGGNEPPKGGESTSSDDHDPRITERMRRHILDGESGNRGGHRYGTDRPEKTEFPKAWSDEKILSAVTEALQRPYHEQERKNFTTLVALVDGVRVAARVTKDRRHLITAHPLDGEGVVRNDKMDPRKKTPLALGAVQNVPLPS